MLDIDKVVSLFSLFSDLEGEGLQRWRGFCSAAAGRIAARLRPDADAAAELEALCAAAAAWAYCDYLAVGNASSAGGEVRVGDITLRDTASTGDRDAEEIRDHFLAGVAHLLEPECPALLTVGGEAP